MIVHVFATTEQHKLGIMSLWLKRTARMDFKSRNFPSRCSFGNATVHQGVSVSTRMIGDNFCDLIIHECRQQDAGISVSLRLSH